MEVIAEHPNYLPAYSALLRAHWHRSVLFEEDGPNIETSELYRLVDRMIEISPNAPETLVARAIVAPWNGQGSAIATGRERDKEDWEDLLQKAFAKDPDNAFAHTVRAYLTMTSTGLSVQDRLVAVEKEWRENPNDPVILFTLSREHLCSGNLDKAELYTSTNLSWNPDNRLAHGLSATIAVATADYERAFSTFAKMQELGWMELNDSRSIRALYFDLGRPEASLLFVRRSSDRAQIYALMGDAQRARSEAAKNPHALRSQYAKMIVDPDTEFETYSVNSRHWDVVESASGLRADSCALNHLAIDAFALRATDPERSAVFERLLGEYFEGVELASIKTSEENLGLMSLHILQDRYDEALAVLDHAIDHGYMFVSRY